MSGSLQQAAIGRDELDASLFEGDLMREPVLIFDYGNVVCHFDYLRACERLGRRRGLAGLALKERLLERGFAELLGRFECGQMAPEKFATRVMALADLELSYEAFVHGWEDIFWLNE